MEFNKIYQIDKALKEQFHPALDDDDLCFYYGEYVVQDDVPSFEASPTNQLISNIKKSPTSKNEYHYRYKTKDICKVGRAIANINFNGRPFFVPTPPSKTATHPEYDPRLLEILQTAKNLNDGICYSEIVTQTKDMTKSHYGHRHSIDDLANNYSVKKVPISADYLLVFDDLITNGNHFKAMKRVLTIHYKLPIYGLFLARRVRPEDDFSDTFDPNFF